MKPKQERVILEPELERFAKHWGIIKCLANAKKFGRWQHQLTVKAFILAGGAEDHPGVKLAPFRRLQKSRHSQRPRLN